MLHPRLAPAALVFAVALCLVDLFGCGASDSDVSSFDAGDAAGESPSSDATADVEPALTVEATSGAYPFIARMSLPGATETVHWDVDGQVVDLEASEPLRHVFCKTGTFSVIAHAGSLIGTTSISVIDGVPTDAASELKLAYADVAQRLCAAETRVAGFTELPTDLIVSANLLTGNSSAGPTSFTSAPYRETNRKYLQALVAMGVKAVTMEINYPTLTAAYYPIDGASKVESILAFYDDTLKAAHDAGLKVGILHNSVLPGFNGGGLADPKAYYATLTKTRWSSERYAELASILERVRPDYLALTTEPTTHSSGLPLSADDWVAYVKGALATVTPDQHARTAIGIGTGTWEPTAFVDGFAALDLTFLEAHAYPLSLPTVPAGDDQLLELERRWELAKSHGKIPMVFETWVYKTAPTELGADIAAGGFFTRDAWSFMQPLDSLYLEVLARMARHHGLGLISPFWSQYFFSYLPFDLGTAALDDGALRAKANALVSAALPDGRTETGRTWMRVAAGTSL